MTHSAFIEPQPAEVREVLEYAAKLIERDGLTKGTFHDTNGHCVIGAISNACRELEIDDPDLKLLALNVASNGGASVSFNDSPDATAAQMIDRLREAASAL